MSGWWHYFAILIILPLANIALNPATVPGFFMPEEGLKSPEEHKLW